MIIPTKFYFIDFDECVNNATNCHKDASCTNTDTAFNCTCNRGFRDKNTTNPGIV